MHETDEHIDCHHDASVVVFFDFQIEPMSTTQVTHVWNAYY